MLVEGSLKRGIEMLLLVLDRSGRLADRLISQRGDLLALIWISRFRRSALEEVVYWGLPRH
jgi:hypothetical protein